MNKNLDKLKQFFRSNKANSAQITYVLNSEIERELRKDNTIEKRLKIITQLTDIVALNRLEEYAVQKLWSLTNDLIEPHKPVEQRHITFKFYTKLIQGQYRDLSMMRTQFFRLIQTHDKPEDLAHQLEMLKVLTDKGKDIQNFEEEMGGFMLKWMDRMIDAKLTAQYLELVVNIIKFNTAYMDRDIIVGIVQKVCNEVSILFINDHDTFLQCLYVIETVISYTVFPNEILGSCIIVLCRAVNWEMYLDTSYKIMKNLLGTQLGYASLLTMCSILNDRHYYIEQGQILRGAVFHINANIWAGNNNSLQNGFKYISTILSSYLKVLQSGFIIVTYEVILSIQRMLDKCGKELSEPAWDIMVEILERILINFEHEKFPDTSDLMVRFHGILNTLEVMLHEGKVVGDESKVYDVIEKISAGRPESSVVMLLNYKFSKTSPTQSGWLRQLNLIMERFYRHEKNQAIRIATIEHLKEITNINRACYEEEILEKVVIVVFSDIAQEQDVKIRVAVCKLILDICSHCESKRCLELLDILDKVISHPFDLYALENIARSEHELEDCIAVVNGLIDLFLEKLHQQPSNHAVKIYHILIEHLEKHYQQQRVFDNATKIRYSIINWMLKVRANGSFHIGYPSPRLISDNIKYSHFLAIENEVQHQPLTPGLQEITSNDERNVDPIRIDNITTLSIKRGCKIIVKCLELERDWPTVQLVLRELPKIMQNKTLIQGHGDVDILARTLSKLFHISYSRDQLNERFSIQSNGQHAEQKDFRALVIPAIASLTTYNNFLSVLTKKKIVEILKMEVRMDGNLSISVQAFTILLMERCDIFERQLADILLAISKVSDTVLVALPILEFMSTITHLPYSFINLNQKQFSYVFATCLPYTSPHRYDHYIVSLAHHIIASWFLRSRLQWRKGYADYIIEGIAKNIDKSMQDSKHQQIQKPILPDATNDSKTIPLVNEDSSLRKRSSSLTEQSSRRSREVSNTQVMKIRHQKALNLQNVPGGGSFDMHNFHVELIETCIDFMIRHTYSLSSALPKRIPAADFLLRGGGQSKTWIVGHNVVTITTNACMDNHDWTSCACFCSDWAEITVRKPTGMLSWLMKFENQIGTFANDFTFHDLTALFSNQEIDPNNPNGILIKKKIKDVPSIDELTMEKVLDNLVLEEEEQQQQHQSKMESVQEDNVQFQPTVAETSVFNFATQPIDIPNKADPSENDAAEDDTSCDEDDSDDLKRNPVRRVNSSPEMRSKWNSNMKQLGAKETDVRKGASIPTQKDPVPEESEDVAKTPEDLPQKKKSYPKETKVSCEAIPEEISTASARDDSMLGKFGNRPKELLSSISAQETTNVTTIPKKQHSADDTFQLTRSDSLAAHSSLQSAVKSHGGWNTQSSSNLPLSPRYANKTAVSRQISQQSRSDQNDDSGIRARSKTISVIGRKTDQGYEIPPKTSDFSASTSSFEQQSLSTVATSGINPSFVFVQLFNTGKINISQERPLLVTDKHMNTLNLLDLIPPYEIHKIGVLYVGPGQANNEMEILRNRNGSLRYTQFLHNLGSLISLKDAKSKKLFVNMEANGREGNFTYVWHDDIVQMTFHVATLMPTLESDPNCNEKKKYIGNDFVTIVYNESGEEYNLNTIKGQFNYACIVIQPLEMGSNLIFVRAKGDIENYFSHLEPKIVSDRGASLMGRQLALHANMASLVSTSLKNRNQSPYANNWLERLRKIKHLKNKLTAETTQLSPTVNVVPSNTAFLKDVFTKYT